MARRCFVCDKGPQSANHVSHANNRVQRWVYPNVHKTRFTIASKPGKVIHDKVCTKCLKAKKVTKVF